MIRYTFKVFFADGRSRTYRMSAPPEGDVVDSMLEMFDNILKTGGLILENATNAETELLEVIEGTKAKKLDFLYLSAQNIDHIEVFSETIEE